MTRNNSFRRHTDTPSLNNSSLQKGSHVCKEPRRAEERPTNSDLPTTPDATKTSKKHRRPRVGKCVEAARATRTSENCTQSVVRKECSARLASFSFTKRHVTVHFDRATEKFGAPLGKTPVLNKKYVKNEGGTKK